MGKKRPRSSVQEKSSNVGSGGESNDELPPPVRQSEEEPEIKKVTISKYIINTIVYMFSLEIVKLNKYISLFPTTVKMDQQAKSFDIWMSWLSFSGSTLDGGSQNINATLKI